MCGLFFGLIATGSIYDTLVNWSGIGDQKWGILSLLFVNIASYCSRVWEFIGKVCIAMFCSFIMRLEFVHDFTL